MRNEKLFLNDLKIILKTFVDLQMYTTFLHTNVEYNGFTLTFFASMMIYVLVKCVSCNEKSNRQEFMLPYRSNDTLLTLKNTRRELE